MKTNQPDVYAIGDVTEFPIQGIPSDESKEKRISFSGWQLAQEQGFSI
jgi:pyruvate/2-oxoglutarate dehydrogenase complex dihydrolipoamide dehydrogenase (E3) component